MTGWAVAAAVTLALILATKLADCISTAVRIKAAHHETNPLARRLMARFGVGATIWGIGVLASAISVLSWLPGQLDPTGWYDVGFTVLGLPVAAIQADVARSNVNGELGPLARLVARAHGRLHGLLRR